MSKESEPNFDPILEATRLVRLDLQRYGWTESDLNLARKLIEEHASVIKEVKVIIGRRRKVALDEALEERVGKFRELYTERPCQREKVVSPPVIAPLITKEEESFPEPTNIIAWTSYPSYLPEFAGLEPPFKRVAYVSSLGETIDMTDTSLKEVPSERILIVVEESEQLPVVARMLAARGEIPENIAFMGVA